MSATNPPDPNVNTFNNLYWITGDTPLTQEVADKRYLRFPTAQGTENLKAINVNGVSQFNTNVNIGSASTANNTPTLTTFKTALVVGSGGNGKIDAECPINVGGFGSINMTTAQLNLSSNSNINQTGGTQNNLNKTNITTANGVSATPTLTLTDSVSTKNIGFIPNVSGGSYNPAIAAGEHLIVAANNTGVSGTETLSLSTYASTNSAVKIAPTSVSMGAGGSSITPTTSVECNGTNVVVNPNIKYPDNTIQNSAFTGAGALSGSYTLSNITLDSNGKITAISNGSSVVPANLTPTSVTITPPSIPSSTAGFYNNYNMGAVFAFSGSGGNNNPYTGTFVANTSAKWDFNISGVPSGFVMTYRILFTFWSGGNWGQTSCLIDFYPNRWTQGQQLTGVYNINNKINGNSNFSMSDPTYAPSGRQYWTYQQQFSGVSGANANFIPHPAFFQIYFNIPDNTYQWQGAIEAVNTTAVQAVGQGVRIVQN